MIQECLTRIINQPTTPEYIQASQYLSDPDMSQAWKNCCSPEAGSQMAITPLPKGKHDKNALKNHNLKGSRKFRLRAAVKLFPGLHDSHNSWSDEDYTQKLQGVPYSLPNPDSGSDDNDNNRTPCSDRGPVYLVGLRYNI